MFVVSAGEYMDYSNYLWVEDRAGKTPEAVRTLMSQKQSDGLRNMHIHNMDISHGEYSENDLRGSRFERVCFNNSKMKACLLHESIFQECDLSQTDLSSSHIWCGNFSGCDLSESNLKYANINSQPDLKKLSKKYCLKTRFNNSNLERADLSFGDFRLADFSGASLSGCNITNTILNDAVIDKKYQKELKLTEEQYRGIQWV